MATQKILIVDDSTTIRMQVRDMLPKGNFEVLEARDGAEGLEVIHSARPNLVLLDFFMPRMNGWEVVQQIQGNPALKTIPIVMMSGRKEDVEKTVPELFDYFEFVSKPFEQSRLFQAIKSATAKARDRKLTPLAPAVTPAAPVAAASSSSSSDLSTLQQRVNQLHAQNAMLQTEVDQLKKQMAQMIAFVRQKLK
ncbi:MAG: response regulator [Kaiparowitsia implicata GSE-PSE-MK54-09C]|jgi:two-component system response regulator|nr:response regulator [Kaiparowitsia implicata GSE-PSE-MK54-09C]